MFALIGVVAGLGMGLRSLCLPDWLFVELRLRGRRLEGEMKLEYRVLCGCAGGLSWARRH